jgi:NAD-dependent deacetylase
MKPVENSLIDRATHLLVSARRVVAFTGAGISTASGIPDFRSPASGLWENVDPLAVASIYGFRQNPQAFYNWIHPLAQQMVEAQPNAAHVALAQLEQAGLLSAVITQNIDMLHTRAGSQIVYELHGHLREATCISCFRVYQAEPIISRFLEDRQVPRCPRCQGIIKPNVILFGEQLPVRELLAAQDAARQAELIIVIGSSLEVAPAGDIPIMAARKGTKLLIINLEPTPADHLAQVCIHADASIILPQIVSQLEVRT